MKAIQIEAMLWKNNVCYNGVAIRDSICEVYITDDAGNYLAEETEKRARQIMNLGFKSYAHRDGMIILSHFGN